MYFFPVHKSQKLMLSLHSCVLILCHCTQLICLVVSDTVYIYIKEIPSSPSPSPALLVWTGKRQLLASGHCHTHTHTHRHTNTYTNTLTLKHVNEWFVTSMQRFALEGLCQAYSTNRQTGYFYIVQRVVIGRIACMWNTQHSNNEVGEKWGWPIDVIPIYSSTCSEFQTELGECCTFSWSWCTHSPWSSSPSTCLTCPPRVLPPSPCCGLSSIIQWVALAFHTSPVATALLCSLILVFKGLPVSPM